MAAKTAAFFAVKLIPGVGDLLSEALSSIDSFLEERKRIKDEATELKLSLATLAKKIDDAKSGHSSPSIQALEDAVRSFKAFVDAWKPERKRDKWRHPFGSSEDDALTCKCREFEKTLENVKLLITVEILQTIGQNHEDLLREIAKHHEETTRNSNKNHKELTGRVGSIGDKIERMEFAKGQLKVSRECLDALGAYKSNASKVRDEAKQQLIALVTSRIDPDDAVAVSLAFIEDNDEELNRYGLHILAKMVADPELGRKLLVLSTVKAVLLALPKMSDAFKENASSFLNDLMSLDRIQFLNILNNWDVSECPITDEGIIRQIIRSADTDDQALHALRKLAVYDKCKLVITKLGGAAEMARIYKENEPFSNAGVDAVISTKTRLSIDVLSSLTEDKACRGMFAESRTSTVIWPLAHFVSNCAFLSTTNERQEKWLCDDDPIIDEYGNAEEPTNLTLHSWDILVASTFGKNRRFILSHEENAGRALCTLSTDLRCRQAFLDVGNAIDLSSGKLTMNAGMREKPYHSLLGWLAMASWAAEDDMNTCSIEGSVAVVVPTEAHLFRVAWNLLSQDIKIGNVKYGTCHFNRLHDSRYGSFAIDSRKPLLVESIGDDLINDPYVRVLENCDILVSRQDSIENFYIASLLLKMIAGSTSDSRSRVVELAVKSIGALGVSKFGFHHHLLSETKPTDMSPTFRSL